MQSNWGGSKPNAVGVDACRARPARPEGRHIQRSTHRRANEGNKVLRRTTYYAASTSSTIAPQQPFFGSALRCAHGSVGSRFLSKVVPVRGGLRTISGFIGYSAASMVAAAMINTPACAGFREGAMARHQALNAAASSGSSAT